MAEDKTTEDTVEDADKKTTKVKTNGRDKVSVPADVNKSGAKVKVKGITIVTA